MKDSTHHLSQLPSELTDLQKACFETFMAGLSIRKTAREFGVKSRDVEDAIRAKMNELEQAHEQLLQMLLPPLPPYKRITIRLTDRQRILLFSTKESPLGCLSNRFRLNYGQASVLFGWCNDESVEETDLLRQSAISNLLSKMRTEERRATERDSRDDRWKSALADRLLDKLELLARQEENFVLQNAQSYLEEQFKEL